MGTIERGILGGFAGKVGTVVGSTWKGLDVMKAKPRKRVDNPNANQLAHRAKFSLLIPFFRSLYQLLKKTLPVENMSGVNGAMAFNPFDFIITGVYPSLSIDFSKVVLAKGGLLMPETLPVASTDPAEIIFSWKNNTATDAEGSDQAVVISYCPELKRSAYDYTNATRSSGTATLTVPDAFSGKTVHTWICFISPKGVSDSAYNGQVTVA